MRLKRDKPPTSLGSASTVIKSNESLSGSLSSLNDYQLKQAYGISRTEYEEIARRQNGLCLICKEPDKLHVDHDHQTGKVRGLLCRNCNLGLGFFQDNIRLLAAAIVYLEDNGSCYG